ncbi:hypothetical protein L9F63_027922 [Diploptera punctata]|uniref:InaF motif containing 2 n=1 Tax=Diploptera punctata TaxID=6984 RepID=A0AAD8A0Y9_DIPPU|nr:hypothetical protein L9F63_027922 [Diploptera punctata]
MNERSDEEASLGSDTQQISNDLKFSSVEAAASDKLYEPKKKRKIIRVLTVVAYVLSVSLAAIMLSLYYVFLWDPKIPNEARPMALRDPQVPAVLTTNVTCFHQATEEVSAPLPQIEEPETTDSMEDKKFARSAYSTPLPLLHSRMSQSYPRTVPSTITNHQTHTNFTFNQLHDT